MIHLFNSFKNATWKHSILYLEPLVFRLANKITKQHLKEIGEKIERDWCAHPRGLASILKNFEEMPPSPVRFFPPIWQSNTDWNSTASDREDDIDDDNEETH